MSSNVEGDYDKILNYDGGRLTWATTIGTDGCYLYPLLLSTIIMFCLLFVPSSFLSGFPLLVLLVSRY